MGGRGESHLSPSKRRKQHQRGPTARRRLSCRKSPTHPPRGEEKRTACSHLQKENVDTLGSGVGSCTFSCGKAKQTGPHHQWVLKNNTLGNWPFVMQEDIKRPMNLEEHTRDTSALSDGWKSTCGPADESPPRVRGSRPAPRHQGLFTEHHADRTSTSKDGVRKCTGAGWPPRSVPHSGLKLRHLWAQLSFFLERKFPRARPVSHPGVQPDLE